MRVVNVILPKDGPVVTGLLPNKCAENSQDDSMVSRVNCLFTLNKFKVDMINIDVP